MEEKSEFLGTEKIRKLLFKLSTPVIIGLLVQALYNVVDTFFVGLAYGEDSVQAIGGLSIAFPVQMIITGFWNRSRNRWLFNNLACSWSKRKGKGRKGSWKCFFPELDFQHTYSHFPVFFILTRF